MDSDVTILIKGAGDIATGISIRLKRSGFKSIVMTELNEPLTIRRTVAFSSAVHDGTATVEGVTAFLAKSAEDIEGVLNNGGIAVIVDGNSEIIDILKPHIVIDAILAKRNTGTKLTDAPFVVGVGPGFTAGVDCHAVIETNRGHNLGRVIYDGAAEADTGVPAAILGYTEQRILRAPADGVFNAIYDIGDTVLEGDVLAEVSGSHIKAAINGVLRGILKSGTKVHKGMKCGDIDPHGVVSYCFTVSDKARAVGGGVLEAVCEYCAKSKIL